VALMQREEEPDLPEHYCLRSFRNRALNYRRSLWRVAREFESHAGILGESPMERQACVAWRTCRWNNAKSLY
jgi:hypothetical protein